MKHIQLEVRFRTSGKLRMTVFMERLSQAPWLAGLKARSGWEENLPAFPSYEKTEITHGLAEIPYVPITHEMCLGCPYRDSLL